MTDYMRPIDMVLEYVIEHPRCTSREIDTALCFKSSRKLNTLKREGYVIMHTEPIDNHKTITVWEASP